MTGRTRPHLPVMVDRVAQLLAAAPAGVVVDCTVGAGGHARAVLETRAAGGLATTLVGIDRDPEALDLAHQHLAGAPGELHLARARFDGLPDVLDGLGIGEVAGALYDLGISSMQVDRAERGFSFQHEGPLDMRMDPTSGAPAADLVNRAGEEELVRIIRRYGEERFARRVAAAVVRARPLHTTRQLADVVVAAIPAAARRGRGPHPATRTFQALRIAVNAELQAFETSLPQALARLRPGGVCAVLAYHSLEDRIAKHAFASAAAGCICPPELPVCACGHTPEVELLTRRPERPSEDEIQRNPRARAARLRAARKLEVHR